MLVAQLGRGRESDVITFVTQRSRRRKCDVIMLVAQLSRAAGYAIYIDKLGFGSVKLCHCSTVVIWFL